MDGAFLERDLGLVSWRPDTNGQDFYAAAIVNCFAQNQHKNCHRRLHIKKFGWEMFSLNKYISALAITLTCVGLVSSSPFGFVSSSPFCVHSHRGLLGWSGALLGWSISPRPHTFGRWSWHKLCPTLKTYYADLDSSHQA